MQHNLHAVKINMELVNFQLLSLKFDTSTLSFNPQTIIDLNVDQFYSKH